jgi:hypothetical protein
MRNDQESPDYNPFSFTLESDQWNRPPILSPDFTVFKIVGLRLLTLLPEEVILD